MGSPVGRCLDPPRTRPGTRSVNRAARVRGMLRGASPGARQVTANASIRRNLAYVAPKTAPVQDGTSFAEAAATSHTALVGRPSPQLGAEAIEAFRPASPRATSAHGSRSGSRDTSRGTRIVVVEVRGSVRRALRRHPVGKWRPLRRSPLLGANRPRSSDHRSVVSRTADSWLARSGGSDRARNEPDLATSRQGLERALPFTRIVDAARDAERSRLRPPQLSQAHPRPRGCRSAQFWAVV